MDEFDDIFSRAGIASAQKQQPTSNREPQGSSDDVDSIFSSAGIGDAADTAKTITEAVNYTPNVGVPRGLLDRKPVDRPGGRFVGKDILKGIYYLPEAISSAVSVPVMHMASLTGIAPEDWGTRWEQTVNKRKTKADLGPAGEAVSEIAAFGALQAGGAGLLKPAIKGAGRLPEATRQGIAGYAASAALGGSTSENLLAGGLSAVAGAIGAPPQATALAKGLAEKGIPYTAGQLTGGPITNTLESWSKSGKQAGILKEQNLALGKEITEVAERAKPSTLASKQLESKQAYLSEAVDIIDNDINNMYKGLKDNIYREYDRISTQLNKLAPSSADNSIGAINVVEAALKDPKGLVKDFPENIKNIFNAVKENPMLSASDLKRYQLGIDEAISAGLRNIDNPLSRDQVAMLSKVKQGLKADYMQRAQKAGVSKDVLKADARYNTELMPFKDMVDSGVYSSRDKVGQVVESIYNGAGDEAYMQTKTILQHMSSEGKEALAYNLAGRIAKDTVEANGRFNPKLAMKILDKKSGQFGLAMPKDMKDAYEGLNKLLNGLSDEAIRAGRGATPVPNMSPSDFNPRGIISIAATSIIENPMMMKLMANINKLDPKSDSYQAIVKTFLFQATKQAAVYEASRLEEQPKDAR